MKNQSIQSFILIIMCYKMTAQIGNPDIDHEKTIRFSYEQLPNLGEARLQASTLGFNTLDSLSIGTLNYGFTYSNVNLYYKDFNSYASVDASLQTLHYIGLHVGQQINFKNHWSSFLTVNPIIFSNFDASVSAEDLLINGRVGLQKEWIDDDQLKQGFELGLGYGTIFGEPQFFPIVSYFREVNNALSFKIGFPKTEIHYTMDERSSFALGLSKEGFYANNSSVMTLNSPNFYKNTKLIYSGLKLNLNYSLRMGDDFTSFLNVGYLPKTEMKVTDDQDTQLFNYKSDETISFGVGINYNF